MLETILFDLDGTILDTNELIIESFLHVFPDKEDVTRELIIENFGKPLVTQLRRYAGRGEAEEADDLVKAYRTYNSNRHDELVTAFPHAKEVMGELRKAGLRIGVVTSKIRMTSERGLKLCGLEEYVEAMVTVEDVAKPKPDAEPVEAAMRLLGAKPETTLMVGDSPYDIGSATAAGARSCAVAWSLKGLDVLEPYGPTYVIHDLRELLDIVRKEV